MSYDNTNKDALSSLLSKTATKTAATQRMIDLARDVMPAGRLSDAMGCGAFLELLHDSEMQHHRIATGYFCRNRLCAGCAWRKSAADAVKISCILQRAQAIGYDIAFATVTAANVEAAGLREALRDYDHAYTEMMRRGKFRQIAGAIRKLEITYNSVANTYHPHIHSIWIMPHGWQRKNNKAHIDVNDLYEGWSTALGNTYAVSPLAQDLRPADLKDGTAVLEFAKYSAKSADYLISKAVFETFYNALRGARLLTYMKMCRSLAADYKAGALDEYKIKENVSYIYRSIYEYSRSEAQYTLHRLEELPYDVVYGTIDEDYTAD